MILGVGKIFPLLLKTKPFLAELRKLDVFSAWTTVAQSAMQP